MAFFLVVCEPSWFWVDGKARVGLDFGGDGCGEGDFEDDFFGGVFFSADDCE